jgi:hypothetical protein
MEGKEKLLPDHQLKTPAWNAAWWVTCHATERGTETYDATVLSTLKKNIYLTIVLFRKWLCQF